MPRLLLDLEIDAACWEFLAARILAHTQPAGPQPIVAAMDHFCEVCEADPCQCAREVYRQFMEAS